MGVSDTEPRRQVQPFLWLVLSQEIILACVLLVCFIGTSKTVNIFHSRLSVTEHW